MEGPGLSDRSKTTWPQRRQQTAAEKKIGRTWSQKNTASWRWTGGPEQPQAADRGECLCEGVKGQKVRQQVGLLLLNEHRPAERFLQSSETTVAFTTCEHDPWGAATCGTIQKRQGRLCDGRAINQDRFRIHIKPPRGTAAAVTVRGKDPQIMAQSLRLTTGLECWGQVDDVQPRAGPLV